MEMITATHFLLFSNDRKIIEAIFVTTRRNVLYRNLNYSLACCTRKKSGNIITVPLTPLSQPQ